MAEEKQPTVWWWSPLPSYKDRLAIQQVDLGFFLDQTFGQERKYGGLAFRELAVDLGQALHRPCSNIEKHLVQMLPTANCRWHMCSDVFPKNVKDEKPLYCSVHTPLMKDWKPIYSAYDFLWGWNIVMHEICMYLQNSTDEIFWNNPATNNLFLWWWWNIAMHEVCMICDKFTTEEIMIIIALVVLTIPMVILWWSCRANHIKFWIFSATTKIQTHSVVAGKQCVHCSFKENTFRKYKSVGNLFLGIDDKMIFLWPLPLSSSRFRKQKFQDCRKMGIQVWMKEFSHGNTFNTWSTLSTLCSSSARQKWKYLVKT